MYNIYISYPYNMLTVLSKVTDVFKDCNVSIKYNKFHDDYHPEYLDTSDIVIFILPDVSFSTPLHRLTNGILSELIKVINSNKPYFIAYGPKGRNDMWNDKLNVMIADSMKKHDTTRTNVYRAIKTAFTNYAAAKNAKPLDEAAEISIIKKMRDERWANAETYQTAGRMDLSAVEADEAEILEELLPKEPTKEELNAALLKLALDKGWYDDNEEHDIHPVQIPKNQMGIAVKELKAKYPAADGKKIADLVKANLCN